MSSHQVAYIWPANGTLSSRLGLWSMQIACGFGGSWAFRGNWKLSVVAGSLRMSKISLSGWAKATSRWAFILSAAGADAGLSAGEGRDLLWAWHEAGQGGDVCSCTPRGRADGGWHYGVPWAIKKMKRPRRYLGDRIDRTSMGWVWLVRRRGNGKPESWFSRLETEDVLGTIHCNRQHQQSANFAESLCPYLHAGTFHETIVYTFCIYFYSRKRININTHVSTQTHIHRNIRFAANGLN